jgi:Cu2+-containing amine oxidase
VFPPAGGESLPVTDDPQFQLEGRVIRWQKWSLHIGFNYREGVVLSDVRYDGRPTFYRLSISDMTVPYGDPRVSFSPAD